MRFSGKTALVTGAAGGIGRVTVAALRAEGARVAVADRDVSSIEAEAHLPGDLRNSSYTDSLPKVARDALDGLDILVTTRGSTPEERSQNPPMRTGPCPSVSTSRRRFGSVGRLFR